MIFFRRFHGNGEKVHFFFSTDLFSNSSARSLCRKLTEDVSGTEGLEIHKSTGRAGPIRALNPALV